MGRRRRVHCSSVLVWDRRLTVRVPAVLLHPGPVGAPAERKTRRTPRCIAGGRGEKGGGARAQRSASTRGAATAVLASLGGAGLPEKEVARRSLRAHCGMPHTRARTATCRAHAARARARAQRHTLVSKRVSKDTHAQTHAVACHAHVSTGLCEAVSVASHAGPKIGRLFDASGPVPDHLPCRTGRTMRPTWACDRRYCE